MKLPTNPTLAITGRIQKFLANTNQKTILPVSCTTIKPDWKNHWDSLSDLLEYVALGIKSAAGVAVQLDSWSPPKALHNHLAIKLDTKHPDSEGAPFIFPPKGPKIYPEISIQIQNSMLFDPREPGDFGIIEGMSHLLRLIKEGHQRVCVDLSNLQPQGTKTLRGQVASGPHSFAKFYIQVHQYLLEPSLENLLKLLSILNQEIRRGGVYRNGALTAALPLPHPQIFDFLEADPGEVHPWLNKQVIVPSDFKKFPEETEEFIYRYNLGQTWGIKAVDPQGNPLGSKDLDKRLLSNVCQEIYPENRGSCMLSHVNLGQIQDPEDIPQAFTEGMTFLCELHTKGYQTWSGKYLDPSKDKQVGLGLLGLANLLSMWDVSYSEFTDALSKAYKELIDKGPNTNLKATESEATILARALILGYLEASKVAHKYKMKRAFTVAPTASTAYRNRDLRGYTTAPEISPPLHQRVERVSGTRGSKVYNHGPVESASQVGFDTYWKLCETLQKIMDYTRLAHSISLNIWEDIDMAFLQKWMDSANRNLYYRLEVDQGFLDKSDQVCTLDSQSCSSCGG